MTGPDDAALGHAQNRAVILITLRQIGHIAPVKSAPKRFHDTAGFSFVAAHPFLQIGFQSLGRTSLPVSSDLQRLRPGRATASRRAARHLADLAPDRPVSSLGRLWLRPGTRSARLKFMQRPTSIAQMRAQTANFVSEQSYAKGLAFEPERSDVFISPYAKCGTTWMQQIVHGLRTGGDMDFGEISEVVPWLELAHDLEQDLQAPQKAQPRAFKSHLNWHDIPKNARYIVVLRDPLDAMVSLFRFLEGWHFEAGRISVEDFGDYFLTRDRSHDYWEHLCSWWTQRDNPDVLLIAYERMKVDLPSIVDLVADFIAVSDPAVRETALRQASFDFMKAHKSHFEEKLTQRYRDPPCGLPPGGAASKVDRGRVGTGQPAISAGLRERFEERWRETMGKASGLPDYASVVDALRA